MLLCKFDSRNPLVLFIEYAIEFIYEATSNKVFAEDNWIGKERRRSLRENRDLELYNILNWK